MPMHDYFRAPNAKSALSALKAMDRLVGPLGPHPAFDGVDAKNVDPPVVLGQLIAFIRGVSWNVHILPTIFVWPPVETKPTTKQEFDELPEDSPWRHGPWLVELDAEARNTLADLHDARFSELAVKLANIEEIRGYFNTEYTLELVNDLVHLARRARDAGDQLYCWSSL